MPSFLQSLVKIGAGFDDVIDKSLDLEFQEISSLVFEIVKSLESVNVHERSNSHVFNNLMIERGSKNITSSPFSPFLPLGPLV